MVKIFKKFHFVYHVEKLKGQGHHVDQKNIYLPRAKVEKFRVAI